MGEDQQPRRVYSPHDVAERLGISDQRLRQLAVVFERIHGELPRQQRARVWTEESVEELKNAEGLLRVREGDYRIIYKVDDDVLTVLVVRIGNRSEVYERY